MMPTNQKRGRKTGRLSGVRFTAGVNSAALILGALTGLLVARVLGPAERGELLVASVGPVVIGSLSICGVDEALVYLLARARGSRAEGLVLGSAVAASLGLGLVGATTAAILQVTYFSPHSHSISGAALLVYATLPLLFVFTQVMLATMRAREQYARWNLSRGSVPFLYLTIVIALEITHHLDATTALMAHYASALALACYLTYRLGTEPHIAASAGCARSILALGVKHHMISVGQLVNQRFDQFLLVGMVGTIQLGYYAVAVTYASLALTVALAPAWHLFSHASQSGSIRRREFRSLQRRTVLSMLLVAGVGSLATPFLIATVFGPSFAPAVIPAQILLFGGPALALSALRAAAWKASGQPLPAALAEGAGILVTLGGLLLFAPRFGIIAAASTSIVAYSLVSALLLVRSAPAVTSTDGEDAGSAVEGSDLELSMMP